MFSFWSNTVLFWNYVETGIHFLNCFSSSCWFRFLFHKIHINITLKHLSTTILYTLNGINSTVCVATLPTHADIIWIIHKTLVMFITWKSMSSSKLKSGFNKKITFFIKISFVFFEMLFICLKIQSLLNGVTGGSTLYLLPKTFNNMMDVTILLYEKK